MKKLLKKTMENISSKVLVVDENLNFVFASNEAEAFLLFDSKNSEGKGVENIFSEKPSNMFELKRLLAEKDSLEKSRRKIYLKGGLEKVCTYEINFFEIDSKKYLLYEFYDANQTKELNRMKRQTISTVTATFSKGLAHEIRNPLSGIKGATQLLEPKLKNDDLKEYTTIILKETERLSDLVTKILDRQFEIQPEDVNIHTILETIPEYLGNISRDKIEITKDYDPTLPELNIDSSLMTQVLYNLANNSVDAMKTTNRENKISLKTRIHFGTFINRTFHKTTCEISFIDNGPGIPEEIIDSIFFPLVSSKEIKSGLGLSIAQGIVSQHGGAIECDSSSSGTKFSIYLPLNIEDEDGIEASEKENYESA